MLQKPGTGIPMGKAGELYGKREDTIKVHLLNNMVK